MTTSRAALARSTRSAYLALSQVCPERGTLLLLCKAALATVLAPGREHWVLTPGESAVDVSAARVDPYVTGSTRRRKTSRAGMPAAH
jgi:hypothetical protein